MLCAPALAQQPPSPYIQADVRFLWGQSQLESSAAATATIGKPTTLPIESKDGIKPEVTILIKELKDSVAYVTVKLRLTPPGQATTSTDVTAIAKMGQSFHVEIRPDDTRNLSLDFTVHAKKPEE